MKTSNPQFRGLSASLLEIQESPKNIEGDSDAPEPAAGSWRDIQMEHACD